MLNLISFNPFRTIGIPGIKYIKPEHSFKDIEIIRQADVLLFPENWQTTFLAYGLKKPLFPSIESIQLGFSKIEMTRALWSVAKQHVPYTEILANTEQNRANILETFPFPFVLKDARNSMGKGVFLIENEKDFRLHATMLDVLYVQEYLPNDGKDLRVCVVGDEVVAAYWRVGEEGAFLHNVAQGGELCFDFIPQDALDLVLRVAKALNINHAGFDVVFSNGNAYILEFNVLFGNHGIREQGIALEAKIYEYLLKTMEPPYPTAPLTPLKGIS
ncbi:ATP-grasp domain-containing protein [Aquibacillus salsiterrae]|uniref:ATP-grasp domain-containing protein n=1 Tax=Aquibacillus salsiterrae TaxID=2950439 RepID=A0A9X4AE34_9BACI|nr:hypothetical protein [Aquibacillus salsiterrae]MDC3416231.1 hypothetical protein [Aquibacillus salsiterrae]